GKPDREDSFAYDQQGNIARLVTSDPSVDDGSDVTYTYSFDALNRPTSVTRPDPDLQGPGEDLVVTWEYDGLSTTRRENAQDGGPQAATTTTNDVWGRLVMVEEHLEATGTGVATTTYAYDPNDNLKTATTTDGVTTELQHDWLSRRRTITRGDRIWEYGYDLNGNLVAEIAPYPAGANEILYTTSIAYDDLDRVDSRLAGERGLTSQQKAEIGHGAIDYTYDTASNGIGRLATVVQTTGTTPLWIRVLAYDARGNLAADKLRIDLAPALGIPLSDERVVERTYNALGPVVEELHGDGEVSGASTRTRTEYDRRGLPKRLIWEKAAPVELAALTRNGAGLPVDITPQGGTGFFRTWTYDRLGRLKGALAGRMVGGSTSIKWIGEGLTYYDSDDPKSHIVASGTLSHTFSFAYDDRHQLTLASDDQDYEAAFDYTA